MSLYTEVPTKDGKHCPYLHSKYRLKSPVAEALIIALWDID